MDHVWNFSPVWEYREAILDGLGMTFGITVVSSAFGTCLGLFVALGLVKNEAWTRRVLTGLVELIRACPPLVLLIWAYYLVPAVTGIGLSAVSTTIIVFTAVFGAFAADIFRGSITAIPRATLDSGRALGMKRTVLVTRIIVPEIFRRSFPALNGQLVGLLKMSSLASVISVPELTYSAQLILAQRPLPFEIYTAIAAAYCLVIFPIVWLLRWMERQHWCVLNPASHDDR